MLAWQSHLAENVPRLTSRPESARLRLNAARIMTADGGQHPSRRLPPGLAASRRYHTPRILGPVPSANKLHPRRSLVNRRSGIAFKLGRYIGIFGITRVQDDTIKHLKRVAFSQRQRPVDLVGIQEIM